MVWHLCVHNNFDYGVAPFKFVRVIGQETEQDCLVCIADIEERLETSPVACIQEEGSLIHAAIEDVVKLPLLKDEFPIHLYNSTRTPLVLVGISTGTKRVVFWGHFWHTARTRRVFELRRYRSLVFSFGEVNPSINPHGWKFSPG